MTTRLTAISDWLEEHWLAVAIITAIFWLIMLSLVLVSWFFGYWYNGLTSGKFDLGSCWQGITAVLAGIGTLISAGVMGWMKYNTFSQYNTISGGLTPRQPNEPRGEPSNERI